MFFTTFDPSPTLEKLPRKNGPDYLPVLLITKVNFLLIFLAVWNNLAGFPLFSMGNLFLDRKNSLYELNTGAN